jgi:urea transport system permease protein
LAIAVVLLATVFLTAAAVAAQPEPQRLFGQLVGDDAAARAAAYDSLIAARASGFIPALEAYRDGLIERGADGRFVIYQSRKEIAGRTVFPVVDAWTLQPVAQPDGSQLYVQNLGGNMLKAEAAEAQKLQQLISVLSIYHPDPARRRAGMTEAANRGDASLLEELRAQLQTQPPRELAIALRESIARIELVQRNPAVRSAAVRALGELGTLRGMADLRSVQDAARKENNTAVVSEIDQALARAENYQWKIRMMSHTFAGLSLGSILVLLALGLSIIFGLMRVINLAHGEFMMVGAYTTYVVSEFFKAYLPEAMFDYFFLFALPLAFVVAGFVGWICEATVIRHLYGRPIETLLATWGFSLLLIQTVRLIFGDTTSLTPPRWLQGGWEVAPDLIFPSNRVFIIVFCALCVAIVYYLVHRTWFGLLLRATTQDRPVASALGVPIRWIDGLTFGFGAGLAGLAGAAVPMFDKLNPNMGQSYVVDSFMVVVVGGVGKLAGAITAGGALGFLTKYIEPWLQAVYGKLAVLGLIILFLQWRPSGLFPHRGRLAED